MRGGSTTRANFAKAWRSPKIQESFVKFLFALILTGSRTPLLTVTMAQFAHELGVAWHLMSATAVMAMIPALIVTLFGQKYLVSGLRL